VVALGEAARLALDALSDGELNRVARLRDHFLASVAAAVPAVVNGSREHRLPGNLNLWFPGCDNEALIVRCREVAFSTGSACTSAALEPSYVVTALTGDPQRAAESVRFGFGRFTTETDVALAAEAVARAVADLRALIPAGSRADAQFRTPTPTLDPEPLLGSADPMDGHR
jgi:cysteine desulfurase